MLAALQGTDPRERSTVYTQHAISTAKPPPEAEYREALRPPRLVATSPCVTGFLLTAITTSAQHVTQSSFLSTKLLLVLLPQLRWTFLPCFFPSVTVEAIIILPTTHRATEDESGDKHSNFKEPLKGPVISTWLVTVLLKSYVTSKHPRNNAERPRSCRDRHSLTQPALWQRQAGREPGARGQGHLERRDKLKEPLEKRPPLNNHNNTSTRAPVIQGSQAGRKREKWHHCSLPTGTKKPLRQRKSWQEAGTKSEENKSVALTHWALLWPDPSLILHSTSIAEDFTVSHQQLGLRTRDPLTEGRDDISTCSPPFNPCPHIVMGVVSVAGGAGSDQVPGSV
ncbi:unnamed protein product [Pleuronectes platessa]|uniref:Uncharacterized protein n=1 Tax=Pleuronectes platessa TaxID=8262 RepID=A0A9N7TVM3_PLEPL|nr:unnamed protein product [Pleuronectes platessa]